LTLKCTVGLVFIVNGALQVLCMYVVAPLVVRRLHTTLIVFTLMYNTISELP